MRAGGKRCPPPPPPPLKEDTPGSSKESSAAPDSGHNLPLSALEAITEMVMKKIGESPLRTSGTSLTPLAGPSTGK